MNVLIISNYSFERALLQIIIRFFFLIQRYPVNVLAKKSYTLFPPTLKNVYLIRSDMSDTNLNMIVNVRMIDSKGNIIILTSEKNSYQCIFKFKIAALDFISEKNYLLTLVKIIKNLNYIKLN